MYRGEKTSQQRCRQSLWFSSNINLPRFSSPEYFKRPSLFPRRRVLLNNGAPPRLFIRPTSFVEQSQQNFSSPNTYQSPNISYQSYQNSCKQVRLPHCSQITNFQSSPEMETSCALDGNIFVHSLVKDPCISDDLWIETKAENGSLYYYHAITRETRWEKPINARVLSFHHLQQMANAQNVTRVQIISAQAQNENACHAPKNASDCLHPIRSLVPEIPSEMIMFPPPSICLPPPIFISPPPASGLNLPNIEYHNINSLTTPTPNFFTPQMNLNLITENSIDYAKPVSSTIFDHEMNVKKEIFSPDPSNLSEEVKELPHQNTNAENENICLIINEENFLGQVKNENELESLKCSEDILQANQNSDSHDEEKERTINTSTSLVKEIEPMEINKFAKLDDVIENNEKSCLLESKRKSVDLESETVKVAEKIDATRPVSCTSIPRTKWCVVWTGDNKHFFYDSNQRASFWELPNELLYRVDVAELVKAPPRVPDIKQERENDYTDIKKIKTENNFNEEKNILADVSEENSTTGNLIEPESKILKENIPHERRIQIFRELLTEKKVSAFSTWQKELHKIVFDPRYVLLSMKERKQEYEHYIRDKIDKEKKEVRKENRLKKEKFNELLKEYCVTSKTKFDEFLRQSSKDERLKAIEKLKDKEALFYDYMKILRVREEVDFLQKEKNFVQLLKEQNISSNYSRWTDVKKDIINDKRFKAIRDDFQRESLYRKFVENNISDKDQIKNNKEDRVHTSLRIREEEVKRDLAIHMKEREKEREQHKHDSVVSCFKALLMDLIRKPHFTWHEAKKIVRKDHRWLSARKLKTEERERYFNEHIDYLNTKCKEKFRQILEEISDLTLVSTWKDVRNIIKINPKWDIFSSDQRKWEDEFNDYMKEKKKRANKDFRELLQETKIITYKTKDLMETSNVLDTIEKVLKNDKRYLVLQRFADERKEMLLSYINKLHGQGPPPPPTSSNPEKR